MKLMDQMTGHDIAGYENAGHENVGYEIVRQKPPFVDSKQSITLMHPSARNQLMHNGTNFNDNRRRSLSGARAKPP